MRLEFMSHWRHDGNQRLTENDHPNRVGNSICPVVDDYWPCSIPCLRRAMRDIPRIAAFKLLNGTLAVVPTLNIEEIQLWSNDKVFHKIVPTKGESDAGCIE